MAIRLASPPLCTRTLSSAWKGSEKVHEPDVLRAAKSVPVPPSNSGVTLLWSNVPETPSVQHNRQGCTFKQSLCYVATYCLHLHQAFQRRNCTRPESQHCVPACLRGHCVPFALKGDAGGEKAMRRFTFSFHSRSLTQSHSRATFTDETTFRPSLPSLSCICLMS